MGRLLVCRCPWTGFNPWQSFPSVAISFLFPFRSPRIKGFKVSVSLMASFQIERRKDGLVMPLAGFFTPIPLIRDFRVVLGGHVKRASHF